MIVRGLRVMRLSETRTVVVTGLGIVSPLGNNVDSFFRSLLGMGTHFEQIEFLKLGEQVKASFFKKRSYYQDQGFDVSRLAHDILVEAASEAIDSAGLDYQDTMDYLLIGTTSGGNSNKEMLRDIFIDNLKEFPVQADILQSWYSVSDYLADRLNVKYGARTLMSACSSGVHAIGYGKMLIQNKMASRVMVGGVDIIDYTTLLGFRSLGINPKNEIRPFDKKRDGFYLGEGAAVIVLESLDLAIARKAPILAQVSGFSAVADGHGHITNPDKDSYVACMKGALKDSGLAFAEIDYINAHGTATQANDIAEAVAIKECFPNHGKIPVSSIKSSTGHTLGAAGAIEALVCLKAIIDRVIPPNKNLSDPDEVCDGMILPIQPQQLDLRNVLCNSFGFGGNNTSLVLSRFEG